MNKSFLYGFLLAIILMSAAGVWMEKKSEAQTAGFAGVYPFWTSGGMMGFFDQTDGRVYLYDQNLENLFMVSKLEKLGDKMKKNPQKF